MLSPVRHAFKSHFAIGRLVPLSCLMLARQLLKREAGRAVVASGVVLQIEP